MIQEFNIGLFPPLSLNGRHKSKKVKNTISIAGVWSRVARLEGFGTALGAVIVDDESKGVIWSWGANLTHGRHSGVQRALVFNHAKELRGMQVAAVNHAPKVYGVQVGGINVAKNVRGIQIGLVNYAEEADASIALLPITKHGVRAEAWTSDTALVNAGLRFSAKYTYVFWAAGISPFGRGKGNAFQRGSKKGQAWLLGGGIGGHIPLKHNTFIDVDLSGWAVSGGLSEGPWGNLAKLRVLVGWKAREHITIWGGPTANALIDDADDGQGIARPGYGWETGRVEEGGVRARFWPGFAIGLRF